MNKLIEKANILMEALPYIQVLSGKTVVVKYGGSAMGNKDITNTIMQDITLLKYVGVNPILVDGGGYASNDMLERLNIETRFHYGMRTTDEITMEIVDMVLAGQVKNQIV